MKKPPIFSRLRLAGAALSGKAMTRKQANQAGYAAAEFSRARKFRHVPVRSAREDITKLERTRLVGLSRDMERNDALVNRFLDLLEQYAVGPHGLRISPVSTDEEWNRLAEDQITAWAPYADLSTRMSWGQMQSLIARLWAVDGEVFLHLTESPDSQRPRIQILESHQVAQPPGNVTNAEVVDGIELADYGRPVAYWVDRGKDNWVRLEAESVVHVMEPARAGQFRGLPIFHPVLNDLLDLQELQELEMLVAKDHARTSKVVESESGELDEEYEIGGSLLPAEESQDREAYYERALGAETVVLRPGDKFEQFQSTRPSEAVQKFWDYVSARAMAGLGVPVQIVLLGSLQGTMTRAALDMANGFFRARSAALAEHFARVHHYVLEKARESGNLPFLPSDWRKWRYTPPRAINVDVGRNSAALIKEFESGFRTLEDIGAEFGWDWRDRLRQKAKESAEVRELAEEFGVEETRIVGPKAKEQPNQASFSTSQPRDEHGRFANVGWSAEKKTEETRKGEDAIGGCIDSQSDVLSAMESPLVGVVDFRWGNEKGGIRHVVEKHGEKAAKKIPSILVDGRVFKDSDYRTYVEKDGDLVLLAKDFFGEKSNHWVITSYAIEE